MYMMKRILFTIIYFLIFFGYSDLLSQTPFTCKGQYYLSLTGSQAVGSQLYRIKIDPSGQTISLDTISKNLNLILNAMGYRITDNFIYGLDPQKATLSRVGADGVAVDLGTPLGIPETPIYYAGDVTPDGRYLLAIGLSNAPQIVKIDLEDPLFTCSFVPLKNTTVSIVDIAFDPLTGILYGHDFRNDNIVTIDPNTGDVNSNFFKQSQVEQLGALFFDSFGNLYGYGSYNSSVQDKFVKINKVTGEMSLLAVGPVSNGQDGCACPYTMELQKIVTPDTTYACTEVVYSFIVSNGSGATRTGINLVDSMPYPLVPIKIIKNPYGGDARLVGNTLLIKNMKCPPGIDTIKVSVSVSKEVVGEFKNQAVLSGLPIALGATSLSDDPATFIEKDSTSLWVLPLDYSFIKEEYSICDGEELAFDATLYGHTYKWADGDALPIKSLKANSENILTITNDCESIVFNIKVNGDLTTVNIIPDVITVELGDSIFVPSTFSNYNTDVSYSWTSLPVYEIQCDTCGSTVIYPLFAGEAELTITNDQGCTDKDVVEIRVEKNRDIYAPNIFSPNRDGRNDIFYISGNGKIVAGIRLRIYDRWGNKVCDNALGNLRTSPTQRAGFILNNPDHGWDGTFKDQNASEGVYAWVAELLYIDGERVVAKGDVTLVR